MHGYGVVATLFGALLFECMGSNVFFSFMYEKHLAIPKKLANLVKITQENKIFLISFF
jgi:hypothetical protein